MVRTVVLCAIVLIIIGCIEGATQYGKCTQFERYEEKPMLENSDMYCERAIVDYCLKFDCPPVNCLNPITPDYGKCPYCEGTCSYGGKVYNVGDHFRCLDGYNSCGCSKNNGISSSLIGGSPGIMCRLEEDGS